MIWLLIALVIIAIVAFFAYGAIPRNPGILLGISLVCVLGVAAILGIVVWEAVNEENDTTAQEVGKNNEDESPTSVPATTTATDEVGLTSTPHVLTKDDILNMCGEVEGHLLDEKASLSQRECVWVEVEDQSTPSSPPESTATSIPESTWTPEPPPPATPTVTDGFVTYDYEPGGESFGKWATDVIAPDNRSDCGRVWQATNGRNTAWTSIFCDWKVSDGIEQVQWVHPMQMNIRGNGTVEFDLYRDLHAVEQLQSGKWEWDGSDPYDVSLLDGTIGLGWYISGSPGAACVNEKCVELGTGAYQLDFPRDWSGHHHVKITVRDGGMVTFYEGPRVTVENTWDAN